MRREWALVVWLTASTAGCNGSDPDDTGGDDTADTDTGDTDSGDTGDTGDTSDSGDTSDTGDTEVPEVIGQFTVLHWPPDAYYEAAEIHAHGGFLPDLATWLVEDIFGAVSLSGLPVWFAAGQWPVPPVGEHWDWFDEDYTADTGQPSLDAGDWVAFGDHATAHLVGTLAPDTGFYYEQDYALGAEVAQAQALDEPLYLQIEGGDDVGAGVYPDAIALPNPPVLDGVDVSRDLPLRAGRDLTLAWTPDAAQDDSILVVASRELGGEVWHVADEDGGVTLAYGDLVRGGDVWDLSVARIRFGHVDLPEGRVALTAYSRQYLYPVVVGAWTIEPDVWPVGQATEVEFAWYDGALDAGTLTVVGGDGVSVTGYAPSDATGQRFTATVTVGGAAPTGLRTIAFGDATHTITATDAAWVVADLPHAGDCESALAEGPIEAGAYAATDAGLDSDAFDTSACPVTPDGPEQAVPIDLAAGERVRVRLAHDTHGQGVLYLTDGCDDVGAAASCVVAPVGAPWVTLDYSAISDETRLLVVDSVLPDEPSGDPAAYRFALTRTGPDPFVVVPRVLPSAATTAFFYCTEDTCAWDGGTVFAVDGYVATPVSVQPDVAEVGLVPAGALTPGPRAASVGASSVPDAVETRVTVASDGTCATASAATPLGAGRYASTNAGLADPDPLTPFPCLTDSGGNPVVVPVAVPPSATLRATARRLGGDAVFYLLPDCPDVAVACSDRAGPSQPEFIEWIAPAEGATVWLVVDGFEADDTGPIEFDLEVSP